MVRLVTALIALVLLLPSGTAGVVASDPSASPASDTAILLHGQVTLNGDRYVPAHGVRVDVFTLTDAAIFSETVPTSEDGVFEIAIPAPTETVHVYATVDEELSRTTDDPETGCTTTESIVGSATIEVDPASATQPPLDIAVARGTEAVCGTTSPPGSASAGASASLGASGHVGATTSVGAATGNPGVTPPPTTTTREAPSPSTPLLIGLALIVVVAGLALVVSGRRPDRR